MENMNSRRDFLKKAGIASVAALTVPQLFTESQAQESVKSKSESKKGLTILFQGDSITDGNRTRDNDWNHIMGHGYACLIASRLWYDYTDAGLMFINRGISGNRVSDLDKRWQQDTLDLKPDVVSILIGVNDVISVVENWNPDPIDVYEATFKKILDRTREALPNSLIVLCEPFTLPLGWATKKPELWQDEIKKRQELARKLAKVYKTEFVELQEPFNKACEKAPANYWIWDGVHPMPAGHELIAREWINTVKGKLSFIK